MTIYCNIIIYSNLSLKINRLKIKANDGVSTDRVQMAPKRKSNHFGGGGMKKLKFLTICFALSFIFTGNVFAQCEGISKTTVGIRLVSSI